MKKSDKKTLNELQQKTAPKIENYQQYKTAFSIAMITIIHLEENYPQFKEQMTNERLEHSKKQ